VISLHSTGEGEVLARLDRFSPNVKREVKGGITRLTIKLQNKVKIEKLQGQVLNVRTGRGQRSIHFVVSESGDQIVGVVSTNVFYMKGWEEGWAPRVAKDPLRAAKRRSRFNLSGRDPNKRPFLVPSLSEMVSDGTVEAEIFEAIQRAVARA
jgi:hypothetical protein